MKKEKYRELYDHCQQFTPKVSRKTIIDKLEQLSDRIVTTVMTPQDDAILRGLFLTAEQVAQRYPGVVGRDMIILSKGLNDCWQRFVEVKEAMHLLDSDGDKTDTGTKFENLLNSWGPGPASDVDPCHASDSLAMWMALACLCPESSRQEFKAQRVNHQVDDYKIALQLKIPQVFVPNLFRPEYDEILPQLIG
jgi:hypothetical protein